MAVLQGRYLMGQILGEGAYGSVCKAIDIKNNRAKCAIKTLDLSFVPEGERRESWSAEAVVREVSLLRKLEHPNVLRVLDFIQDGDKHWLVTELCEGPDLQKILDKRGALHLDEAAAFLRQCVAALRHLHEHSMVHRDVKPANVVVFEPLENVRTSHLLSCSLRLVDFGLARLLPEPCHTPQKQRRRSSSSKVLAALTSPSPGGSRHGGSRHGGSTFGSMAAGASPGNSRHGGSGSRHGGSTFGSASAAVGGGGAPAQHHPSPGSSRHGSRHGGSLFGGPTASPAGSEHGGSRHGSRHNSRHGGSCFSSIEEGGGVPRQATSSAAAEDPISAVASPPREAAVKGGSLFACTFGVGDGRSREGRSPNSSGHSSLHGSKHGGSMYESSSTPPHQRPPWGSTFELSAHGGLIYAPPELHAAWDARIGALQVSGRDAARIDVYALGLMLRYMLTGLPPNVAETSRTMRAPPRYHDDDSGCGGCLPCLFLPAGPPRLLREMSELPQEAVGLVEKMTSKNVIERLGLSGGGGTRVVDAGGGGGGGVRALAQPRRSHGAEPCQAPAAAAAPAAVPELSGVVVMHVDLNSSGVSATTAASV